MDFKQAFKIDRESASGLAWTISSGRKKAGDVAGSMREDGYWRVFFGGKRIMVHRIIYQLAHGQIPDGAQIDHVDLDPSNNTPENIRLATASENQWNTGIQGRKASGLPKGISRHGKGFQAQIKKYGCSHAYWSTNMDACLEWLLRKRLDLHGSRGRS